MSPIVSDETILALEMAARKTIQQGIKIYAKQIGMNPDSVELVFDESCTVDFKVSMNDDYTRATITTGQMALDRRAIAIIVKNSLESIQKMVKIKSKFLESWETSPARAQRFNDALQNHHQKLLKPSEIKTVVVHTVIMTHVKSNQSVAITSDEVDTFSLMNEAHLSLSRKVFGE